MHIGPADFDWSHSPENLGGFCFDLIFGAVHMFQNLQRLISCAVEDQCKLF